MTFNRARKQLEYHGRNALRALLVSGAIRALRQAASQAKTIEDYVVLARDFRYCRIQIPASQVEEEICGLLGLLAAQPPKTVLEIGTYKGGTLFLFSRVAAPDALVISLDLPPIRYDCGYPAWRGKLFRSFARERQRLELVQADSHQPAAFEKIQQLLAGRPVDFLLIDGDHSYEGVKADYQMYSPLVAPGGLIAFHDIVPRIQNPCGVPRFWQEIKGQPGAREFVGDWRQNGFGIGTLRKGVKLLPLQ